MNKTDIEYFEEDSYVGYRVKLNPTKEQISLFNRYFGIARYVYNLGINIHKENYEINKNALSFISLNNKFNELKNTEEYNWLKQFDSTMMKLVLKDVVLAYKFFFDKLCNYPKYKSKKKSKKQFPIRSERLSIREDYIFIPSIGKVSYNNYYGDSIIGVGDTRIKFKHLKFTDTRIIFNGVYYYLTFSLPKDLGHNINSYQYYAGNIKWQEQESSEAIGIDLGLRNDKWIKDSRGNVVIRPENKKAKRRLKHLHKKFTRQYKANSRNPRLSEKMHSGEWTKGMQKTIVYINKYYKKITYSRQNAIYEYCNKLLEEKPKAVVLESIRVKSFIMHENKNCTIHKHRRNSQIIDAALYNTSEIISRKMSSNGIPVIYADPNYPSTQICSVCGNRQKIGKSQIYKCPICGTEIDRDLNAAINLSRLAY